MFIFEGRPGIAASTGIGSWFVLRGAAQLQFRHGVLQVCFDSKYQFIRFFLSFNIRTNQAICVHQPRIVQLQELVASIPRVHSSSSHEIGDFHLPSCSSFLLSLWLRRLHPRSRPSHRMYTRTLTAFDLWSTFTNRRMHCNHVVDNANQ